MPLFDCSSSACNISLFYISPAIGTLSVQFLVLASLKTVNLVSKNKQLGTLNPVPYPFMFTLSLAWFLYGLLLQDYFLTVCNIIGIWLGIYYVIITYSFSSIKQQHLIMNALMSTLMLIFIASILSFLVLKDYPTFKTYPLGLTGAMIQLMFYIAPLLNMRYVIKSRNSSSIHLPLSIMSVVTCGIWTLYGIVLVDWWILSTNIMSLLFSLLQLTLRLIYPAIVVLGEGLVVDQPQVVIKNS